ncbi:hypothetical protein F4779DRAFT_586058 [Xylariaceae sp. FL0662B]|nr:hypothetical protein F4779DRAFT_586058 [Xylariaceae sp. FL0662B]
MASEYSYGSQPYSTLEVRNIESWTSHDPESCHKEAVAHPESLYPQAVPGQLNSTAENDGTPIPQTDTKEAPHDAIGKRTCGLQRRTFYMISAVVLLLVIGAIVGGVVGGLASRDDKSTSASEPNTGNNNTTGNTNILGNSKLAASNWTDPGGNTHRSVFFQDPSNSIIARQWDSQNKTWTTRNISDLMQSSTTGPLNPVPGTSLASASCDNKWGSLYEVHLWFLVSGTQGDTISKVHSSDPIGIPDYWIYENTTTRTWNDSQLAATWQRCWRDDCVGNWVLAHQGPDGGINVANHSNWNNITQDVVSSSAVSAKASLAIVPALMGAWVDGLTLASQRRPGSMDRSTFLGDWNWKGEDGTILSNVDPLSTQQFAATTFNSWRSVLYVALSTDRKIRASLWTGDRFNSIPEISFVDGGPTNFSAIAMTTDAMFYGISGDEVWEYSVNTSDPSVYTFVGKVYP